MNNFETNVTVLSLNYDFSMLHCLPDIGSVDILGISDI